ncbi:LrgB family protein [Pseudalkalibacillus sp. SCS-8]|uniref:LrgB family protein n=1 Tax=Pseudalkalibacillus nanhaiensis TaxID=3115291 RepID=UPI0032DB177E
MDLNLYSILFLFMTIGVYIGGTFLYKWKKHPFTIPIITATGTIILVLIFFGIPYDSYMVGAQWVDRLLGPAVVALAYPLYLYRNVIKQSMFPLLFSIFGGVVVGIGSGFLFARMIGMKENVVFSVLPKSVTTPVAMEITRVTGGTPSLAVAFVMIAGIGGVMLAPYVFKWFKIDHEMAKGIGLGSASHAIGTSKALEYGHQAAAISSVAMTLSAILASLLIPIMSIWL